MWAGDEVAMYFYLQYRYSKDANTHVKVMLIGPFP